MADRVKLPAKLPVWETMARTYRFFWAERRQFWLLAVPAIAVVSLLSALSDWSIANADAERLDTLLNRPHILELPFSALFLLAASTGAGIWAYVCYSIAWHRSYLVPGEHVTIGSCYRWGARQWRFLWTLVKIAIVFALISAAVAYILSALTGIGAGQLGNEAFLAMGPTILIGFVFVALLLGAAYTRLTVCCRRLPSTGT